MSENFLKQHLEAYSLNPNFMLVSDVMSSSDSCTKEKRNNFHDFQYNWDQTRENFQPAMISKYP